MAFELSPGGQMLSHLHQTSPLTMSAFVHHQDKTVQHMDTLHAMLVDHVQDTTQAAPLLRPLQQQALPCYANGLIKTPITGTAIWLQRHRIEGMHMCQHRPYHQLGTHMEQAKLNMYTLTYIPTWSAHVTYTLTCTLTYMTQV